MALAASLWGTIGLFVHELVAAGLSPLPIVFLRAALATLILFPLLAAFGLKTLRLDWRHLPLLAGMGALGLALPNWAYFTTIAHASLSVAVAMLYTGPAFVVVLARIFFREPLSVPKVLALLCTTSGTALVAGIGEPGVFHLSLPALATGLLSGCGYALYSIFGKPLNRAYPPITVTAYSFLFAALVLFPVASRGSFAALLLTPRELLCAGGLALLATVFPYFLYNYGLRGLEAGRAAILTTLEPLVAALIGYAFLGDRLAPWQVVGFLAILVGASLSTGATFFSRPLPGVLRAPRSRMGGQAGQGEKN
ncbi:DMT family transporter [Desulfothermobacter acidiphilus]|uniref:DMT family transporter n=1 Tax=Desulfothermobacter acidiphilus TaxID=1938353 RepID=UPI003F8A44D9